MGKTRIYTLVEVTTTVCGDMTHDFIVESLEAKHLLTTTDSEQASHATYMWRLNNPAQEGYPMQARAVLLEADIEAPDPIASMDQWITDQENAVALDIERATTQGWNQWYSPKREAWSDLMTRKRRVEEIRHRFGLMKETIDWPEGRLP